VVASEPDTCMFDTGTLRSKQLQDPHCYRARIYSVHPFFFIEKNKHADQYDCNQSKELQLIDLTRRDSEQVRCVSPSTNCQQWKFPTSRKLVVVMDQKKNMFTFLKRIPLGPNVKNEVLVNVEYISTDRTIKRWKHVH
jgi:hypothetical protein